MIIVYNSGRKAGGRFAREVVNLINLVFIFDYNLFFGETEGCVQYLYADLNRLPLSTLGVCHPLSVIQASVDHRLGVFRLLLQRKSHPTNTH